MVDVRDMNDTDIMEAIETIVEKWQVGKIDSEQALQEIIKLVEEL